MTIGYFNGEFIPVERLVIPIDERDHQFGDGVYACLKGIHLKKHYSLE